MADPICSMCIAVLIAIRYDKLSVSLLGPLSNAPEVECSRQCNRCLCSAGTVVP